MLSPKLSQLTSSKGKSSLYWVVAGSRIYNQLVDNQILWQNVNVEYLGNSLGKCQNSGRHVLLLTKGEEQAC